MWSSRCGAAGSVASLERWDASCHSCGEGHNYSLDPMPGLGALLTQGGQKGKKKKAPICLRAYTWFISRGKEYAFSEACQFTSVHTRLSLLVVLSLQQLSLDLSELLSDWDKRKCYLKNLKNCSASKYDFSTKYMLEVE